MKHYILLAWQILVLVVVSIGVCITNDWYLIILIIGIPINIIAICLHIKNIISYEVSKLKIKVENNE